MKTENKMRFFNLVQKTGFRNVTGGPVIILDEDKKLFYDTSVVGSKVWEFNLPPGSYYLMTGKIRQTIHPVNYKTERLPPREHRWRNDPEKFPVIFTENKYTGSVYWDAERSPYGQCVIVLDNSLKELSLPELTFILYHEYGHRWYDNERACDLYATNRMLEEGYNPSQIGSAIIHTLSEKNEKRMEDVVNSLTGI